MLVSVARAVSLTVLDRDDERLGARGRGEADAPLRARVAEVEALLTGGDSPRDEGRPDA